MNKIEILAPAGSFESVIAAVRSGADAVYVGAKQFSARSSAQNFTVEELKKAVEYCHIRAVNVYLTVNTLILDSELSSALNLITDAAQAGIDAVILQDVGLARLVHEAIPSLAMHASTQMTIHTPEGAKALYDAGFKRAVLARELSREEIALIRAASPIELEIFVHGALCMCVSGQCYFSAMLGARSGNRGACAQPCRLPFAVNGHNGYALSLKDNSIVNRIRDIQSLGITSAKIEGRMKRPEYVAAAVRACVEARNLGCVNPETTQRLSDVFSRTGFTDGYYSGKRGREMFGFRRKDDVTAANEKLFSQIRTEYKDEAPRVGVDFQLYIKSGEKAKLTASDGIHTVSVFSDEIIEPAENRPSDIDGCEKQLRKTGGTPYFVRKASIDLDSVGIAPASLLNRLRRDSLEKLSELRCTVPEFEINRVKIPSRSDFKSPNTPFEKRIRLSSCRNLEILNDFDRVIIPLFSSDKAIAALLARGLSITAEIPRVMFGAQERIEKRLMELYDLGIRDAVVHNIGAIALAKRAKFTLHGGFGLNITNTASVLWAEDMGFADAELSFELSLKQIEQIGGNIPRGITSFGLLPLMITRNCPNKSAGGICSNCNRSGYLTDRMGINFPFDCDGITTQIYNSVPLVLSEKLRENASVNFEIFNITTEQCTEKTSSELIKNTLAAGKVTNGLYHRGIK